MRVALLFVICAASVVAQCPLSVSPNPQSIPATENSPDGGVRRSFSVVAATDCFWSARPLDSWITISFGQNGRGNGSVGYTAARNQAPTSRTGTIEVGTVKFRVNQAASSCMLTLNGTGVRVPSGGSTGSFGVTTTCVWSPLADVDWILVQGGGTGSGTVTYTVLPNPSSAPRLGRILIYDRVYEISQDGSPCSFTLEPSSDTVPAVPPGPKSANVVTLPGCAWSVSAKPDWVSITPSNGVGPLTLTYTVERNNFAATRSAGLVVGGATLQLTQAAANCQFQLSPPNVSLGFEGSSGGFNVSTACSYIPQSTVTWIRPRVTTPIEGPGRIEYIVDPNPTSEPRSGAIAIGTAAFTVVQAGRPCTLTLSPDKARFSSGRSLSAVSVTSDSPCWTAESFAPWITIRSVSMVGGNGTISYEVAANADAPPRTGTIRVGPANFEIEQEGLGIFFTAESVAHGATAQPGPVSPGEVIVIYGTNMGPDQIVTAQLTPDGSAVTTDLAGTRVFFDGVRAPILYTSDHQISAVVPFGVSGRSTVAAVIEYGSLRSKDVILPVTELRPGIFTGDKTGTGQGAILNQNYSYNGDVPAERGSVIQIFATGGGLNNPVLNDGSVVRPPLPPLRASVEVLIDGVAAQVEYAGAAPTLVAGVVQINARIPASARSGNLPIVLRVGGVMSRAGVTVSVQ